MEDSKRPAFGNRQLTDSADVFDNNAWDNVEWDEEMEREAREMVAKNSSSPLTEEERTKYEAQAAHFWNEFYDIHENRFFKDRHWLETEFQELFPTETSTAAAQPYRILEVGCGVGNTLFPLVTGNQGKNVMVHGCDFSNKAIDIVKSHELYQEERCDAFVADISDPTQLLSLRPQLINSVDVIVMIFVLSAIHPDKWRATLRGLLSLLKPGGKLLFRDYGRYDLAQLRFKPGRCLEENFYVRGDGTRVYFFSQEEVRELMTSTDEALVEEMNHADRRLIVNRRRQLKMYRVWIQCKYRKEDNKSALNV